MAFNQRREALNIPSENLRRMVSVVLPRVRRSEAFRRKVIEMADHAWFQTTFACGELCSAEIEFLGQFLGREF
jgi:hypothetical protein